MNDMASNSRAMDEARWVQKRRDRAMARLKAAKRLEQGQGGVAMVAALAYGEALEESSRLAKLSHYAKLFCIAATGLIPVLLFARVAL